MRIHLSAFFIFLILFFCTEAYAQRRRPVRGAVSLFKVGMNINYLSGELPGDGAARVGLNIGIAPSIPVVPKVLLKPELSFSQLGGRIDYDQGFAGFNGNVIYRLNYLTVPLMLGYKLSPRLSLEAGPFMAFEVGGTFDFEGDFLSGYGSFDRDAIEDFNYGLALGIKMGPLGIRYMWGLQEVASNQAADFFLGNATTHAVQIYLQRSRRRGVGR